MVINSLDGSYKTISRVTFLASILDRLTLTNDLYYPALTRSDLQRKNIGQYSTKVNNKGSVVLHRAQWGVTAHHVESLDLSVSCPLSPIFPIEACHHPCPVHHFPACLAQRLLWNLLLPGSDAISSGPLSMQLQTQNKSLENHITLFIWGLYWIRSVNTQL